MRTRGTVRPRLDRTKEHLLVTHPPLLSLSLSFSYTKQQLHLTSRSNYYFTRFRYRDPLGDSALSRFHRMPRQLSINNRNWYRRRRYGKCRWIFVNFPRKLAPLDRVDSLIGSIASELLWNGSSVNESFLSTPFEGSFSIFYKILKARHTVLSFESRDTRAKGLKGAR